ncbi:hypothetical protein MRY87_13685 [bacterium]|nr:hypothetical protein [bacterium]
METNVLVIVILVSISFHCAAGFYIQYRSAALLRALAENSSDLRFREAAETLSQSSARKRWRALDQYRKRGGIVFEGEEISDTGTLPHALQRRVQRFGYAVNTVYGTFWLFFTIWLGGLLLQEFGIINT